ncbi:MAG TPA: LysE family transporter [Coriobacteriia bacterium]|nr:LysE family transporter [Coriobacteriia bacterium]
MDPAVAAVFFRTLLIGLAVAMPVGAMAVLCIERTLQRGWRSGVATGMGIATADGVYAAVAAFGITVVSSLLVTWQAPLRIIGGLALMALGIRALLRPATGANHDARPTAESSSGYAALYGSALALTLTNPMTIIAFAAVFMSAGLAGLESTGSALAATAGVAVGSLCWWLALCTVVASVRHGMTDTTAAWLGRASGFAITGFGLAAVLSAFFV